jgi:hypothetical protein
MTGARRTTLLRALMALSVAFNVAFVGTSLSRRITAGRAGPMAADLGDRLGLDAEGQARLDALRAPVVAARAALAAEAADDRNAMISAIVAGDEAAAQAARARLVERQVGLQRQVVAYLAGLGATLDAGQRADLATFLEANLFPGLGGQSRPGHAP